MSTGQTASQEIAPEPLVYLNWPVGQQVPSMQERPAAHCALPVQVAQLPLLQPWSAEHAWQACRSVPQVAVVVVPFTKVPALQQLFAGAPQLEPQHTAPVAPLQDWPL